MMSLFHRKSPLERALGATMLLVRKGGKPVLGIVGAAVAATALSAAASARRDSA
jgi:hypothetical protein